MDQNFHYKLGRVDEKQDMILQKLDALAAVNKKQEERIGALERFQSRVYGIAAGVSTICAGAATFLSKAITL